MQKGAIQSRAKSLECCKMSTLVRLSAERSSTLSGWNEFNGVVVVVVIRQVHSSNSPYSTVVGTSSG